MLDIYDRTNIDIDFTHLYNKINKQYDFTLIIEGKFVAQQPKFELPLFKL